MQLHLFYILKVRSTAAAGASGGASAGNLFFYCKSSPALRQRSAPVAGAGPLQAAFTASQCFYSQKKKVKKQPPENRVLLRNVNRCTIVRPAAL